MAAAPTLTLHWWDAPGRGAEPARLALAIKGVKFEDRRYALGSAEANDIKAKSPFGQMPVLQVGDQLVTQSNTILRFVGRLCGLLPEDPLAAAKVEALLDFVAMDVEPAALCSHLTGEEQKQARVAAATPGSALHRRFSQLDAAIKELYPLDDGAFVVGDNLEALDIAIIKIFCETSTMISGFYSGFPTEESLFEPFPHLRALRKRVASIPQVQSYYDSQKEKPFYGAFCTSAL